MIGLVQKSRDFHVKILRQQIIGGVDRVIV